MERTEELKKQFARTPAVRNSGMKLQVLGDGRAEVRIPVKNKLFTHHGLVTGYMIFGIANMAGAYAAMTRIESGYEVAASEILKGEYIEAGIKEEEVLVAEGRVSGGKRWTDSKGHERRQIVAMITVYNKKGRVKAEFTLSYSVVPQAVLKKVIERLKKEVQA